MALLAVLALLLQGSAWADAGLEPGAFSAPVRTFSGAGVTLSYPEGATAAMNVLDRAIVNLEGLKYTVAAWKGKAFRSYEEQRRALRAIEARVGDLRLFETYESTFKGARCLVAKQAPSPESYFPVCDLFVYPDADTLVYISALRNSVKGSLKKLLRHQDVLAVLHSVTW
ncbi:MAG TPA: hypothetical protein DIC53_11485 [Synergistaceae bacterium]|nr:hypothetical protein [Synergistaceae bacterium]